MGRKCTPAVAHRRTARTMAYVTEGERGGGVPTHTHTRTRAALPWAEPWPPQRAAPHSSSAAASSLKQHSSYS